MKAYELKITLRYAHVPIWRKIVVPAGIKFRRLHDTLQVAMGWFDCHLHEFSFEELQTRITSNMEEYQEYRYYKTPEGKARLAKMTGPFVPDMSIDVKNSESTLVDKYLDQCKTFTYLYDFGDSWEHEIEVLRTVEDYAYGHPTVLAAEGDCPPEDCGGTPGYEDFLRAWNDPKHPEHESMREWGEGQEYGVHELKKVNLWMRDMLRLKKVK